MANLDPLTLKLRIEPEMNDTAMSLLRDMIIAELAIVFPETIKPMELLREEMRQMAKEEVENFIAEQYKRA